MKYLTVGHEKPIVVTARQSASKIQNGLAQLQYQALFGEEEPNRCTIVGTAEKSSYRTSFRSCGSLIMWARIARCQLARRIHSDVFCLGQ